MDAPAYDFPALLQAHVSNARLFATRNDMLSDLGKANNCKIVAEIGVSIGDFSSFIINSLNPELFVAFDLFDFHERDQLYGVKTNELLGGKTHVEYYKNRFKDYNVVTELGSSQDSLARYHDHYFDLIYVDGGHEYADVKGDAELSKSKIKESGIIIFNDYICYDYIAKMYYGVIQAVHELIYAGEFEVIGFALAKNMFCDIAIKRRTRC